MLRSLVACDFVMWPICCGASWLGHVVWQRVYLSDMFLFGRLFRQITVQYITMQSGLLQRTFQCIDVSCRAHATFFAYVKPCEQLATYIAWPYMSWRKVTQWLARAVAPQS